MAKQGDFCELCLNFVQGGGCYATGGKCLLGVRGVSARNQDGECELHGRFDVWVTETNELFITDMGFPSEEPKQCLALAVNETLARKIAEEVAKRLQTSVKTTERRCMMCQNLYWTSGHEPAPGLCDVGQGYLCPSCILENSNVEAKKQLGVLQYWCG